MNSSPAGGQTTFVTINGVSVPAAHALDALLAQVAELSLALAAERAHSRHLSEVLMMGTADPPSDPADPSDGPTAASEGDVWGVASGL
jgi:hypothetical protein